MESLQLLPRINIVRLAFSISLGSLDNRNRLAFWFLGFLTNITKDYYYSYKDEEPLTLHDVVASCLVTRVFVSLMDKLIVRGCSPGRGILFTSCWIADPKICQEDVVLEVVVAMAITVFAMAITVFATTMVVITVLAIMVLATITIIDIATTIMDMVGWPQWLLQCGRMYLY